MEYRLRIRDNSDDKIVYAKEGELLIDVLRRSGHFIQAPCGGTGKCGKCKAEIEGIGDVLTCQTVINSDLAESAGGSITVVTAPQSEAVIKSLGILPAHNPDPIVWELDAELEMPSVRDQRADDERIIAATGYEVPWHLLKSVPVVIRRSGYKLRCVIRQDKNEIASLGPIDENIPIYGISIDIGTTTLSASLFDMRTGNYIASANSMNPQRAYGADVISRIDYAATSEANAYALRQVVVDEMIRLSAKLCGGTENISVLSIAGNTTMMHLLCGHDPSAIAKAPFIPVTKANKTLYFHEVFGEWTSEFESDPVCILLPSLSGYVGADISAGIIATDLDLAERPALLVDIGTNGEIALQNNGRITCCSVAAGPAFEGANIACGTGGVKGAVDRTSFINGYFDFTTIGDFPPSGICGSGIVSVVSTFLKAGIIDETGRFCEEDSEEAEVFRDWFSIINGERVFVLNKGDDKSSPVYVTQKDIREIQNAKAAVCAGIRLLISKSGLSAKDIDKVFIAGGFGNFLDIDEAYAIGLIPGELKGKVISAGNTSAAGASLCMLDFSIASRLSSIFEITEYYELSTDSQFTEMYVDSMFFE